MKPDPIEQLRAMNPVSGCPPPRIDDMWAKLDAAGEAAASNDALVPRRRSRAGEWLGRGLVAVPSVVAILAAVAIAAVALTAIGDRGRPRAHAGGPSTLLQPISSALIREADRAARHNPACRSRTAPGASISYGSPSSSVLSSLAALRRPRSPADSFSPSAGAIAERLYARTLVDVYARYIRQARAAHGVEYYLIPAGGLRPSATARPACLAAQLTAARHLLPHLPSSERAATLRFLAGRLALERRLAQPRGETVCLLTIGLYDLRCGIGTFAYQGSASRGTYINGIIPDGVATVTLRFEGPSLTITTRPVNNVFVAYVPRNAGVGPISITWRSARGAAIRVLPEPNANNAGTGSVFCAQNPRAC
jgi:hypothetical protein